MICSCCLLTLFQYLVEKMIPGAADQVTNEDRISNLPRDLIHKILEDHMQIGDAARTSILSKTWKNIWETHPNILLVDSLHLDGTPCPCLWIKQLPEKGVRILWLHRSILDPVKDMSSYFFSCSDLTRLYLKNWKLNPPHNFRGFRNLTTIYLHHVVFTTDMSFGTQVQHFELCNCAGIEYLDSQLTNHGKNIKYFEIVRSKTTERRYALDYDPYTDIKKSFNLRRLLGNMPSIETLGVDAISLTFLDPALILHNHLSSTMENLKTLRLYDVALNDVYVISNAFCLLRSMPILEHLGINVGSDINLTGEQYMESPDCADITLNQLQDVIMIDFLGSRAELLFTKLLLASSPSLERITFVRNTEADDPREDFRITRELMQFPRKSPVQIFWN